MESLNMKSLNFIAFLTKNRGSIMILDICLVFIPIKKLMMTFINFGSMFDSGPV